MVHTGDKPPAIPRCYLAVQRPVIPVVEPLGLAAWGLRAVQGSVSPTNHKFDQHPRPPVGVTRRVVLTTYIRPGMVGGVKQPDRVNLRTRLSKLFDQCETPAERVAMLNEVRDVVAEFSPFQTEPVDVVRWVPAADIQANDYNPNSVAPPEMELLRLSIMADGYTQPIVANAEDDHWEVIDGFHRNRVGKEFPDVRERVQGFLPVVQIRGERGDRPDRMASTIRHNRARGKHQVIAMSEIVMDLKRRNWSDDKIGRELGMDPDEVLRLTQITGLAEAFADRDFSEAWEADMGSELVGDDLLDGEPADV